MIVGAALVRFLLSSGGIITVFSALSLWNAVSRTRCARVCLLLTAVLYTLLAYEPLPTAGARWLAAPFHPLTNADLPSGDTAIVLLGSGGFTVENWAGERHQFPDPAGADRTMEAFRVFRLLDARWIISSGGMPDPDDPDQPSAHIMKNLLIELGVPPDRVLVEAESRTTREQAVVVQRLLTTIGSPHVTLVTSASHMRRALAAFRAVGIAPLPAVARTSPHMSGSTRWLTPSEAGLQATREVIHELLGLLYYRIRGWQA